MPSRSKSGEVCGYHGQVGAYLYMFNIGQKGMRQFETFMSVNCSKSMQVMTLVGLHSVTNLMMLSQAFDVFRTKFASRFPIGG